MWILDEDALSINNTYVNLVPYFYSIPSISGFKHLSNGNCNKSGAVYIRCLN